MAYGQEPDTTSASKSTARRIGEAASEATETMAQRAQQALEHVPGSVKETGREATENAQAVVGNFREAMEKSTRENPLTTVAMAVAVGFLVGSLWR